jgi:hypothetical protein
MITAPTPMPTTTATARMTTDISAAEPRMAPYEIPGVACGCLVTSTTIGFC